MITSTPKKLALLCVILLTILFTSLLQAEDSMLTKKPYFTYRIETKGALYESKINGILLEEDFEGNTLNFEQPVNQYMRSGKNRIGFQISTHTPEDFDNAKITVGLYVNQDGASEPEKNSSVRLPLKPVTFLLRKVHNKEFKQACPQ